jgi:hypothetical protein
MRAASWWRVQSFPCPRNETSIDELARERRDIRYSSGLQQFFGDSAIGTSEGTAAKSYSNTFVKCACKEMYELGMRAAISSSS